MESSGQTESRTRRSWRRWLIVSICLAAGAVTAWWLWPRADPRLIGTWEVPKSLFQAEATRYQFSANGWGHRIEQPSALSLDEVGPYVQNFRWWVENDHLVLELNNRIGYERLLARLQSSIGPLFGYARQLHTEQFRIHDIRNDSLTMDVKTTYRTFILVGLMQPTTLKRVRQ